MKPVGTGKTLSSRPGWKAFIRAHLPEVCPVRALFAHIISRFWLCAQPMNLLDDILLFPGNNGKQMSQSNHGKIVSTGFSMIDICPPKITHELRVFAAQSMHEKGVPLEVRLIWLCGLCSCKCGAGCRAVPRRAYPHLGLSPPPQRHFY